MDEHKSVPTSRIALMAVTAMSVVGMLILIWMVWFSGFPGSPKGAATKVQAAPEDVRRAG
jgi:hypothetical protein